MRRTLALAVVMLTLGTAAARATTFALSFASAADQSALGGDGEPGFSGSATLIGTELSPGQYNITSSIGTMIVDPNFAAQAYAYIPNPSPPSVSVSPDGFLTYDGAVFDGTPRLSSDGLLWVGAANGADEDIFFFEGNYFILDVWGQNDPDGASLPRRSSICRSPRSRAGDLDADGVRLRGAGLRRPPGAQGCPDRRLSLPERTAR